VINYLYILNWRSELTNIDGNACSNIPEAVNKLVLSAHLDHSCETGWNKHDKIDHRVKDELYYLQVYDKWYILLFYSIFWFETCLIRTFMWPNLVFRIDRCTIETGFTVCVIGMSYIVF
jgi:hypothetical protein